MITFLEARGIDLVSIKTAWAKFTFNAEKRTLFYADMVAYLRESIAPFRALAEVEAVARRAVAEVESEPGLKQFFLKKGGKYRSSKATLALVSPMVRAGANGATLSDALSRVIPGEEAALLSAGERAGLLPVMEQLLEMVEKKREIRGALLKELIPAGLMLLGVFGVMIVVFNLMLEAGSELTSPEALEKLSLAPYYFGTGAFVVQWWWAIALVTTAVVVAVASSLDRWRPTSKLRSAFDAGVAPWSLYGRLQTSFFLIAASSMMASGRPFKSAAEDILVNSPPWAKTHVRRMLQRLAAGKDEVQAMQVGMFPYDVEAKIAVYSMLADKAQIMKASSKASIEILLRKVGNIGKLAKLVTIVLVGAFVVSTYVSLGEVSMAARSALQ